VALQFPQSENNLRLTEKFPSSTSLWQVLRRFETGVTGGTPYPLNITQRGIAERNTGAYGSGRMFYEMPTLALMNRELSSFLDLQKTLAQIGLTSGSALLRLNFKHSGKPLEEAMLEITQYFKELEDASATSSARGAHAAPAGSAASAVTTAPGPNAEPSAIAGSDNPPSPPEPEAMEDEKSAPEVSATPQSSTSQSTTTTPSANGPTGQPRITAFLAPEGDTSATTIRHNEEDYVPTVDHAKTHQSRLEASGKNTRLPSDAELDAQRKEKEAKMNAVSSIAVRFRMPDQTQIQTFYTRFHTAQNLFTTMSEVLRYPTEPFALSYRDGTGKQVTLSTTSTKTLIQDLKWTGATLVYVSWGEGVSEQAKKEHALNDEYYAQAVKLRVEQPKDNEDEDEEKKGGSFLGGILGGGSKDKGKSKLSAGEKEAKLGKLLGFNKKK
jgi:tether containing UBX domain for GLUT4